MLKLKYEQSKEHEHIGSVSQYQQLRFELNDMQRFIKHELHILVNKLMQHEAQQLYHEILHLQNEKQFHYGLKVIDDDLELYLSLIYQLNMI